MMVLRAVVGFITALFLIPVGADVGTHRKAGHGLYDGFFYQSVCV